MSRVVLVVVLLALSMLATPRSTSFALVQPGYIETFAGGGAGEGALAMSGIAFPTGIAVDGGGDLYFTNSPCRLRKVSGGVITTVAGVTTDGTPMCESSGDVEGGPAQGASVSPSGIAIDGSGDVYFTDLARCTVRKVSAVTITTAVGTPGTCSPEEDGATDGPMAKAMGIEFSNGDLYIAVSGSCKVKKVSGGTITTIAGTGSCGSTGDGGPATSAMLSTPVDVAVTAAGDVFIAESCRIRLVSGGNISTVAGNGVCTNNGDGSATSVSVNKPGGIAVDGSGKLYIADTGNCRIRELSSGALTTIAGTSCGYNGDGPALTTALNLQSEFLSNQTSQLTLHNEEIYFTDTKNCRIRKIAAGLVVTVAGDGRCFWDGGDGGAATAAGLIAPRGIAVDAEGGTLIADQTGCRIRRVLNDEITTYAGTGVCGYGGDDGPPLIADVQPSGVIVTPSGEVIFSDGPNCRIRKIEAGVMSTIAGTGICGYNGDSIAATSAMLNNPRGLAINAQGEIFVADRTNCRVRRISGGQISTVAGTGTCGQGADGGAATSSQLNQPTDVEIDPSGNLVIADRQNCRVRKVQSGIITAIAGINQLTNFCLSQGNHNNGIPATQATLGFPVGIAYDSFGRLYVSEQDGCRVRRVTNGLIEQVAGLLFGQCDLSGDGGPAADAGLALPGELFIDSEDNVYVSDEANHRIRRIAGGDADADGVLDGSDNCVLTSNPGQGNFNADAEGDHCDHTDTDGCFDSQELGTQPILGGSRNPSLSSDFYDVNGSKIVDAVDIGLVRSNFNSGGPTPPEDEIYDRSVGAAPWAPGPPDNMINAVDIGLVRNSFNHSCLAPP